MRIIPLLFCHLKFFWNISVCVKCQNRRYRNAVQLVLVLATQKDNFISFSLDVGQWENLPFSPLLEREGALVVYFYPDTNWKEVVYEHVEDTVCRS